MLEVYTERVRWKPRVGIRWRSTRRSATEPRTLCHPAHALFSRVSLKIEFQTHCEASRVRSKIIVCHFSRTIQRLCTSTIGSAGDGIARYRW